MNNDELVVRIKTIVDLIPDDLRENPNEVFGLLDESLTAIESLQARAKELESLVNKIYNGDCSLTTASIIAANFIPTEQPE